MSHQLEALLYKRYPKATAGMARQFALSLPAGWFDHIEPLLEMAEELPDHERPTILQIKEKFSGLRVYYMYHEGTASDRFDAAVIEATKACETTCEFCGEPGEFRKHGKGWKAIACVTCYTVERHERNARTESQIRKCASRSARDRMVRRSQAVRPEGDSGTSID